MFVTNFIIVGRVIQPPNIIELQGFNMLKFVVETKTWYKGNARTEVHEILLARATEAEGFFDPCARCLCVATS